MQQPGQWNQARRYSRWARALLALTALGCGARSGQEVGAQSKHGFSPAEASPADEALVDATQLPADGTAYELAPRESTRANSGGSPSGVAGTMDADAAAALGAEECQRVCAELTSCQGQPLPECVDTCMASYWVEPHRMRCLALRIGWINEEGCSSMLATYQQFLPTDHCD